MIDDFSYYEKYYTGKGEGMQKEKSYYSYVVLKAVCQKYENLECRLLEDSNT